jgi:uroporphyrinogen-III decarboxylase
MQKPLFVDWSDADTLVMPDPLAPGVTATVEQVLKEFPDKAVIVNMPNVLTRIEAMVPQEEFYVALMENPEAVEHLFSRMSDVMALAAERLCDLDIAALYVQDDVAANNGLLMSPGQVHEFVFPHWKKVIDVAHAHDKPVFFHTDGKVEELYDVFADELKVRMLNPLQPDLQDVGAFAKKYQGRTGIYGGLYTGRIHMMSIGEIRKHVFDLFEAAGTGGGLIISSHDLDLSTTEEQLDALVGAVKECTY